MRFLGFRSEDTGHQLPTPPCSQKDLHWCTPCIPAHPPRLGKGMPAGLWILLIIAPENFSLPFLFSFQFLAPPRTWSRAKLGFGYQTGKFYLLSLWLAKHPATMAVRAGKHVGQQGEMGGWSISRNLALELLKCPASQLSPIHTICC